MTCRLIVEIACINICLKMKIIQSPYLIVTDKTFLHLEENFYNIKYYILLFHLSRLQYFLIVALHFCFSASHFISAIFLRCCVTFFVLISPHLKNNNIALHYALKKKTQ